MDFELPPELTALADQARAVAAEWKGRVPFPEDSWIALHDAQLAKDLAARGWLGMTWPVEWGGGGRSPIERFIVFEQLISGGVPLAAFWFADRQMGPTLLQFGTDEQRQRWLPGILDGSSMWSIGMSEPDNGSDVAGLRTRAVPADDGSGDWIVNGQKVWTSGAAISDWIYLVARTDPDAKPHAGLSELVVDLHSPGVEIRRIVDMTGNDHFCEVHLTDVRVPAANLVGELNGSFRQLMRQMEHERGGVDRLVSNKIMFEDLKRSGWIDTADPLVRQELARIETAYTIGRMLVLREVLGQAPANFSAATKTFCTEFEQRLASFAASVAGPRAMLFDPSGDLGSRIARAVCYAPAYTIMGGTAQILRNILGERLLGLPPVMLDALDLATDEFGRRLGAVHGTAWDLPTPCPEWDVRYLAAHVVGGNRFATAILGGTSSAAAIELVMSTPQLGDDAVEAWTTTGAAQAAAFRAPGALTGPVDHPLGELTGEEFLRFRIFDISLHAWDLARAIGVDDELAPALVDAVLSIVEAGPPGMGFGIEPVGSDRPGASPQARLLALTGRRR